jgi:hypothetical protein
VPIDAQNHTPQNQPIRDLQSCVIKKSRPATPKPSSTLANNAETTSRKQQREHPQVTQTSQMATHSLRINPRKINPPYSPFKV